jgi:hypothetical protein
MVQLLLHREEGVDILRCHALEFGAHALRIVPPGEYAAVFESHLHAGFAGHHAQAIGAQLQVTDHFRPQHAGDVGSSGDATARGAHRIHLFGDRAAADHRAALEHQHLEAAACQIGRSREAIVSGSDDDRVAMQAAAPGSLRDAVI